MAKEEKKVRKKTVEFSLDAPKAKEVYLAGEFNDWDTQSLPMKKGKDGVWRTKIKLAPSKKGAFTCGRMIGSSPTRKRNLLNRIASRPETWL